MTECPSVGGMNADWNEPISSLCQRKPFLFFVIWTLSRVLFIRWRRGGYEEENDSPRHVIFLLNLDFLKNSPQWKSLASSTSLLAPKYQFQNATQHESWGLNALIAIYEGHIEDSARTVRDVVVINDRFSISQFSSAPVFPVSIFKSFYGRSGKSGDCNSV